MNIQTLGERIRNRRKELKLTQKQLATALKGVSHVAVSQWESNTTKPNAENILDLSIVLQCEIAWLLRGKGESNVVPASIGMAKVPLISYVQAGQWTSVDELRETCGDFDYILTALEVSENAFALEIKGDSMMPDFIEGDIVIIEPNLQPSAGEFVVAVNGNYEATFKKYRPLGEVDQFGREHFELVPLNPDHHSLSTHKQEIRIIGTMIEHRIYRRKR